MAMYMKRISISGFKSIEELNDFEPTRRNVLIGENGCGKSNFISFFRLLNWMTAESGNLQEHIARQGGGHVFLFDGPDVTQTISVKLTLTTESGDNEYEFRLAYAGGDTLIFTQERFRYSRTDSGGFLWPTPTSWKELDPGSKESRLFTLIDDETPTGRVLLALLRRIIVYQFHNTSQTSRMRQKWSISDNRLLKEDGGNIAPVLLRLQEEEPSYYQRIVEILRLNLSFFGEFVLEPSHYNVMLQWKERGSDVVFDAAQASDGMLRFIALVTLLSQPEVNLPSIIVLDEPELGLHPSAVKTVADLIHAASDKSQVFIATQSLNLINHFSADDVVIVERRARDSRFSRLREQDLEQWLDEYSLGELWEKNALSNRPAE